MAGIPLQNHQAQASSWPEERYSTGALREEEQQRCNTGAFAPISRQVSDQTSHSVYSKHSSTAVLDVRQWLTASSGAADVGHDTEVHSFNLGTGSARPSQFENQYSVSASMPSRTEDSRYTHHYSSSTSGSAFWPHEWSMEALGPEYAQRQVSQGDSGQWRDSRPPDDEVQFTQRPQFQPDSWSPYGRRGGDGSARGQSLPDISCYGERSWERTESGEYRYMSDAHKHGRKVEYGDVPEGRQAQRPASASTHGRQGRWGNLQRGVERNGRSNPLVVLPVPREEDVIDSLGLFPYVGFREATAYCGEASKQPPREFFEAEESLQALLRWAS
eukprot:TRINITY_DN4202_c1_g1_i4.p2 TRINITY_DN4202_c1_g1~~TRINITY_DN4202_c1_g1_i4.p2  ORF type:complete len:330 (-),score=39.42 TRINITY_DN4202_c1_g1_i4:325-1314(-)